MDLAQLLFEQRDLVVQRFVAALQRKDLSPAGLSSPSLVDHIPDFLDDLIAALREAEPVRISQDATDMSRTARRHGGQRWALGFDQEAVIREYGVLRNCIIQVAREAGVTMGLDESRADGIRRSRGPRQGAARRVRRARDQACRADAARPHRVRSGACQAPVSPRG